MEQILTHIQEERNNHLTNAIQTFTKNKNSTNAKKTLNKYKTYIQQVQNRHSRNIQKYKIVFQQEQNILSKSTKQALTKFIVEIQ